MSIKLSYAVLEKLGDARAGHNLELAHVSVARFADDRSPIELGVTVPFVARFSLRANAKSAHILADAGVANVAAGSVVLAVNARGEITSELSVELAADVPQWIADHFTFAFEVRGVDRSVFRPHRLTPVDEDDYPSFYPWIQEITTFAVRGELIDVELDIEPRDPPAHARKQLVLTRNGLKLELEQAVVHLGLEVDGDYSSPAALANSQYWIALHSDQQPDLKLRVAVHDVTGKAAGAPAAEKHVPDDAGYERSKPRRNQSQ